MKTLVIILSLLTAKASCQQVMSHAHNQKDYATSDTDVIKFITKVGNNGGSLKNTEKRAVRDLVKDLKDSSGWANRIALYPFVGASRLSCGINLKDTTQFNITFVAGSPGNYTAFGVTRAGVTSTGIIPLTHMSNTNGHLAIYSRSNSAANQYDMGASDDAPAVVKPVAVVARYGGNLAYGMYGNGSYATSFTNTDSRGLFMANYLSGVSRVFKNGVSMDNTTEACSLPNKAISLFSINANGTEAFVSTRQYAFASIGGGMTTAQALTDYNIIQKFQFALNRQN